MTDAPAIAKESPTPMETSSDRFVSRRSVLEALGLGAAAAVLGATTVVPTISARAQTKNLTGFGIVLMHGKGGSPGGLVGTLAAALQDNGALATMPSMPWQGSQGRPRGYSETYEQALARIDRLVADLKSRGAQKIVVAGQSLGANAALGYAARRGKGLAAVVALAPGHTPERAAFMTAVADGVAAARKLVASGRGHVPVMLPDINQGQRFEVSATPAAYLSFFDPAGPAVMPRNVVAMPALPLLWVIGRSDPLYPLGESYAYGRAPKHAKSKYLVVEAGHRDTPHAARQEVVAWLRML